MTVVGQTQVVYTYDNANRLTQVQQGTSTVTIGYDDADWRTSMTYPNTNKIEYSYNAASELTSLTYKQGATTLGDLTYTYDAAGNRIKTGGSFARSNISLALTTTNYNANNQQTIFGTSTGTYDLNGNLATITDGGGTTTYTWNARNRLTAISGPGLTASFTYDSFGRRNGRTVNGTVTNYLYDGLNPVQEKNGGTVTANLLTGIGIDEFFTRTDGVGVRALLPDALGSTVALGDGTGTLLTQYTYEPFGFPTQTGSATTNSYKFTGREDDGTGLMYYRARYYHHQLQRFISEDPIGFLGGDVNLYAYVANNPVNLVDPSGNLALAGALVGGGINLAVQLAANGGDLASINLTSMAASAVAGATGVGLATAISSLTRGIGTQLVLNMLGSAGIGAASTLGQNLISGKCLTQDVSRNALLSGFLGGLGFAAVNAQFAISAAAANTAWNNASLSQRLLSVSNAISLPANANSLAVGVGNALAIAISNSSPIITPP